MATTRTTADLLAEIRSITDRTVDPALTDPELLRWLNEEVRDAIVYGAKFEPDEYTATSSTFTIPSGNTLAIAGGGIDGVTKAQFLGLRGVDITADNGAHWKPLKAWRFTQRGSVGQLSYRLRKKLLHIEPADFARTYPIRYWYIEAPAVLTNGGGEEIDLPFSGDDYAVHGVAAKVRIKFEEDPVMHYAGQRAAEESMRRYFALLGPGEPEVIRGASDADDEDF